jgi:pimeloyl-ACP methyl ester carboxylesterase
MTNRLPRSMPLRLAVALTLAFVSPLSRTGSTLRAPNAPPVTRDSVVARLGELRRIHTPDGIELLEAVAIEGTTQWVSVRGKHESNPVIVMIHGGPGTPMMPLTWAYQSPWEDFFTVVNYDQRGVGKNAVSADRDALAPTLSFDQLVRDAEAMVTWVRSRLGVERVVVMGYSYGTMIGMSLAQRHPEWLHAYVGVGQVSGSGDDYLYTRLRELAQAAGQRDALRELDSIAPYPRPGAPVTTVLLTRKWARYFNGGWYGKPSFDLLFSMPSWAPEYTSADVAAQTAATQWTTRTLVGRNVSMLPDSLAVPVVVIQGRHDLHTPYEPARAYIERLRAPSKSFLTLEWSAHVPMLEEPGRFLQQLLNVVRPLTGAAK